MPSSPPPHWEQLNAALRNHHTIARAYGEHRYASVDDVFGSGHLPDSVCAMALAWIGAAPKAVMSGRLSA
jgi:hypothetical protein